jgi:hypothetical protein
MVKHITDRRTTYSFKSSHDTSPESPPLPGLSGQSLDLERAQATSASLGGSPASGVRKVAGTGIPARPLDIVGPLSQVVHGGTVALAALANGIAEDSVARNNAVGDAEQSEALVTGAGARLTEVALGGAGKFYSEMALADAEEQVRPDWITFALDASEHLGAIGASGVAIQSANLPGSVQAASSLGYLGPQAKSASQYSAFGGVQTAGAFASALRHHYGSEQTMESFESGFMGYQQASSAVFSGKFPGLQTVLSVMGGVEALQRVGRHAGGYVGGPVDNVIG